MLGLVLTVLASTSPAFPSASVTCPADPTSCDGAALAEEALEPAVEVAPPDPGPRDYATPAVIDCRAPAVPSVLQTLVGDCDGTPRDASYRASRYPESEASSGGLAPARRERRQVTACHGLPRDGVDLTISPAQPLALYAVAEQLLTPRDLALPRAALRIPWRAADRLERPPRS